MSSLDITSEKAKQLDDLEVKAISVLQAVLDGKRAMTDVVKVAQVALSAVAKNRQTLTSREGIRFAMARSIADTDGLSRYVEATQPEIKKLVSSSK